MGNDDVAALAIKLHAELAAIRSAFPEGHPARSEEDIATEIRELFRIIWELRSINVEPGISLGKATEWKQQRDKLQRQLGDLRLENDRFRILLHDTLHGRMDEDRITAALGTPARGK